LNKNKNYVTERRKLFVIHFAMCIVMVPDNVNNKVQNSAS